MSADGFQVLLQTDHSRAAWLKDVSGYYYLESDLAPFTLKKLRCRELVVIDHHFAKDDRSVYWGSTPIPGSDPSSFTVVSQARPLVKYFSYDQRQLYALSSTREGLQIWTDVDTASLEFFDESTVFADRNHLFHFNDHFITYQNLNSTAAKEYRAKLQVLRPREDAWWNWTEVDLAPLSSLGHGYLCDKSRVFYDFAVGNFDYPMAFGSCEDAPFRMVLSGADPSSFQAFNPHFGKDRHRVYHLARPIAAEFGLADIDASRPMRPRLRSSAGVRRTMSPSRRINRASSRPFTGAELASSKVTRVYLSR